ncbi:amidase family protein [Catenovulum sp. SX2]|uniref:amidase family protein n=1 Tax=Catenovulum sp. SX2 TaxID=3398614 RepID=UPI003F86FB00
MLQQEYIGIFCQQGPKHWQYTNNGVLAGNTLAVKDLFKLEGYKNSAGNPVWYTSHQEANTTATALEQLMQAGCVFSGFTHTDEIAYSLEGNNIHYGCADNPKLPGHVCGGSSMGSAAAVARQLADIGLGTDTGGSIRIPASYCGLYGIRTSHNLVSRQGLIGLAPEFDTVGWLCNQASLLKKVGEVLLPKRPIQQVDTLLVCYELINLVDEQFKSHLIDNLQQVTAHFAKVVPLELPKNIIEQAANAFRVLQGRAIVKEHQAWIDSSKPSFAANIQHRLELASSYTAEDESLARHVQQGLRKYLAPQLKSGRQALYLPTSPTYAPKIGTNDEKVRAQTLKLTCLAGLSGSCQVHLPLNVRQPSHQGKFIPYGFSLLMGHGHDLTLLNLVESISASMQWEQY